MSESYLNDINDLNFQLKYLFIRDQVLHFNGVIEEAEAVQDVKILFYLSDNSITVLEVKPGSKCIEGTLFQRRIFLHPEKSQCPYTWIDLVIGSDIFLITKKIRITGCDNYTKEFFYNAGMDVYKKKENEDVMSTNVIPDRKLNEKEEINSKKPEIKNASYSVPTMPQALNNFPEMEMAQMGATLRWSNQPQMRHGPAAACGSAEKMWTAAALQAMQSAPFTARAITHPAVAASQYPAMRAGMNARPITVPTTAAAAMGPTELGLLTFPRTATMCAANVNPARPAYKYTYSMGNPPQPLTHQPAVAQQAVHIQAWNPLTTSMLADANAQEQKQMLGERLFPVIHRWYPEFAGKITDKLLEIDNSELLHMLKHHEYLKSKIIKMAAMDLDPMFVKGLRLLHSKSKDSAEQLKQFLDDAIAQSKQSAHAKDTLYTSVKLDGDNKIHLNKTSRDSPELLTYSTKITSDANRDHKPEKRAYEKSKPDSLESLSEAKIPKLETPQYPPLGSSDIPKLEQYVCKKHEETDSSDENADAGDFAMEMGLACVICKQIEVTLGNQLIECQECHSLYHQECHRLPASDYDVNNPREVWYCAKCVKSMKKMATKTQKTAKTVSSTTKEPVTPTKMTESESPPAQILPFKRTELKPTITQGNSTTSANKPIGLAGLAANFGNRTAVSTATTSSSSTTRVPKTTAPSLESKSLSTLATTTAAKTTSLSSSSTLLSKMIVSSSVFTTLSSTTTTQSTASAVASASTRATPAALAGNGNSGHKVASCSPLMSADKQLQIMKKKASKQQEKRRLSSK